MLRPLRTRSSSKLAPAASPYAQVLEGEVRCQRHRPRRSTCARDRGEAACLMDAASSPRAAQKSRDTDSRLTAEAAQQLIAWAFIAPGRDLHDRLLRVPALPKSGPELPRLHPPVLHRRHGARSSGSRTTSTSSRAPTFAPALINTAVFTLVSIAFQYSHRPGARGLLLPAVPALRDASRALPRALAAAAPGVGIDLGMDAQQRIRRRQCGPCGLRHPSDQLADLAAVGAWSRCSSPTSGSASRSTS